MIQQFFYDLEKVFKFVLEHLNHFNSVKTETWRSESSCSANYDAVISLSNQIATIYKSLFDLSDNDCGEEVLEKIDLKFLCCLDLWSQVLAVLQKFDSSSLIAMNLTLKSLQILKESGIRGVMEKARRLAKYLEIDSDFPAAR